ncbi:MAG: hypothetical protein DWQ10_07200 [Calditrichaeota bacterium]|nr:MAG: hypothetical protein DWQ10_07200 [Calditrichota bacterium]
MFNSGKYFYFTRIFSESDDWKILQNSLNSFQNDTTISFVFYKSAPGELTIFSKTGEQVALPVNVHKPAGNYTVNWHARDHSSGVYFCKMKVGKCIQTKKLVLVEVMRMGQKQIVRFNIMNSSDSRQNPVYRWKIALAGCLPFLTAVSSLVAKQNELSINNDTLLVKLDLTRGGAISYISKANSTRSLVNIADEGRYIQQSYYAGKTLDRRSDGQSAKWSPWSWNPIQVGDAFRNRAEILASEKNDDTLYVKCIPMQWDMNNMPAEAEMEQWIVLKGSILEVHNKLTCFRTDSIYGENIANDQELPAVYPISALRNLYGYLGAAPFTKDTLNNPDVVNLSSGFWGVYLFGFLKKEVLL